MCGHGSHLNGFIFEKINKKSVKEKKKSWEPFAGNHDSQDFLLFNILILIYFFV
jgi:hypothetical protein